MDKPWLNQNINKVYWSLCIILFILQTFFIFNSLGQIRYEELAESVRNPFWIQNRLMYDGFSGSMGWYGLLAIIYNIFGYHIFTAKFVRLFIALISLICLSVVLKKFFGTKKSIVPLLAIGLSPTLLYFNTLQSTYGMDLQYIPICIFLIISINQKNPKILPAILFGFVSMVAWLSYPTFIFYLPSLFIAFFLFVKRKIIWFFSFTAFLLPLIFTFLFIQNRQNLIYDPVFKSGLFRGAGVLQFNTELFFQNLGFFLLSIFDKAQGYYFEVTMVDFSNILPVISIALMIIISIKLSKTKLKKIFYLILLVLFFNLLIISFSVDKTPGVRRYTPILASLYGIYTLVWYFVLNLKIKIYLKKIAILALLIIPLHHLISYPINYLHLSDTSIYKDTNWFAQAETPDKSLDLFLDKVKKEGLSLACIDNQKKFIDCRYSEIYAAVAGSCIWNRLQCHKILGYDLKSKSFIPLSVDLWESYYFGH